MKKAIALFIILFVIVSAISWAAACGLFYLITLCFGWTFSFKTATGIWLILLIVSSVFKTTVTVKEKG